MNNKEFITKLSQRAGFTQADTQKLVTSLIDEMANCFSEGDIVSVGSFGSFEVKKRMERVVIVPATNKRMLVPPKLVLAFKPAAWIKEKLKNGGPDDE